MAMLAPAMPYIVGGLVGAGVGVAGSMLMNKSSDSKMPQMPTLPNAPKPEDSVKKAEDATKRKKAALTQTVYSNPLGMSEQAGISRKILLGN